MKPFRESHTDIIEQSLRFNDKKLLKQLSRNSTFSLDIRNVQTLTV